MKADSTLPISAVVERPFGAGGQRLKCRRCSISDEHSHRIVIIRKGLKKLLIKIMETDTTQ
jgi:hypothetical protein